MGYVIDKLFGCPETLEDIRTVYLLLVTLLGVNSNFIYLKYIILI